MCVGHIWLFQSDVYHLQCAHTLHGMTVLPVALKFPCTFSHLLILPCMNLV